MIGWILCALLLFASGCDHRASKSAYFSISPQRREVIKSLNTVVLPVVSFEETSLLAVTQSLMHQTFEVSGRRIVILIHSEALQDYKISMHMENVSLKEALELSAILAGCAYRLNEDNNIMIVPHDLVFPCGIPYQPPSPTH